MGFDFFHPDFLHMSSLTLLISLHLAISQRMRWHIKSWSALITTSPTRIAISPDNEFFIKIALKVQISRPRNPPNSFLLYALVYYTV